MANTLEILNSFAASIKGKPYEGWQGDDDYTLEDPVAITVSGAAHVTPGILPTATVHTVFDDDDDHPIDFDYFFFVADGDVYIKVHGSGSNFAIKQLANVPFTLTYDSLLAAADTVALTTEPSLTDIDRIEIGNYTGNDVNYIAAFFD